MEEFQKVSVGLSSVMHLSRMAGHKTLCGRWWWADNDHGLTYCRSCQSSLSRLTQRALDLACTCRQENGDEIIIDFHNCPVHGDQPRH